MSWATRLATKQLYIEYFMYWIEPYSLLLTQISRQNDFTDYIFTNTSPENKKTALCTNWSPRKS